MKSKWLKAPSKNRANKLVPEQTPNIAKTSQTYCFCFLNFCLHGMLQFLFM